VTLFLHGNAGNVTHRFGHIRAITDAGSSVLILDYRGYGKSNGWPTEAGLYRDADAGYQFLRAAGYASGQILVHGESLGAAVAVDLASRNPCAAVVLEAPFTSARDMAKAVLPGIGPLLIWSFDSESKIARVLQPLLVIQGDHDEVVPTRLGEALFEEAPGRKSMWVIHGAGHNDIVETAGAAYPEQLRSFYDRLP